VTMEESPAIISSRHGSVAVVTLNRPNSINAINMEIRVQLPVLLRAFNDDADITAIVIAGAGERGFCAGADVKELRPAPTPVGERHRLTPHSWIEALDQVCKPVIAAVHGICVGAGLEIALACDIRVAATDAHFALPETALGVIPGGGGTQRLSRLIGLGRALDMVLTGEALCAQRALETGLVTRLAPSRQAALAEALRLAELMAERAPIATAYAKEAVLVGATMPLRDGLRLEKSLFAILASTKDRQEAVAAFREKRKPRFSGE
jgi:enoyl-CoA hydratase/carnithine racemase